MTNISNITPDEDAVIRMVYGEAGGEPSIGQQAVAATAMNRAKQYGQRYGQVVAAPGQYNAWTNDKVQKLDPNSPQYQAIAQNVLPVLRGQAKDPTNGATHYINKELQIQNGQEIPNWASGDGQGHFGKQYFYKVPLGRAQVTSEASMPSVDERTGVTVGGPAESNTGTPSDTPTSTSTEPTMPTPAERAAAVQGNGVPAPVTPSPDNPTGTHGYGTNEQIIQQAIEENGQNNPFWKYGMGALVPANSALGGFLPQIIAGAQAAGSGLNNFAAEHGLFGAQKTPYGMGDVYNGVKLGVQHTYDQYAQNHPFVNGAGTILGAVSPIGADAWAARGGAKLASMTPGAAPVVGRLLGGVLAGGLNATGTATSEGENAGDVTKSAVLGGVTGGALGGVAEGVGTLGNRIINPVVRSAALPVTGAMVGGTVGGLFPEMAGAGWSDDPNHVITDEDRRQGAENGAMGGFLLGQGANTLGRKVFPNAARNVDDLAAHMLLGQEIERTGKDPYDFLQGHGYGTTTDEAAGKHIDNIITSTKEMPLQQRVSQGVLGAVAPSIFKADINPVFGALTGFELPKVTEDVTSVLNGKPVVTQGVRDALERMREQPAADTAGRIVQAQQAADNATNIHPFQRGQDVPATAGVGGTGGTYAAQAAKPTITIGDATLSLDPKKQATAKPKQPDKFVPEAWTPGVPQRRIIDDEGNLIVTTIKGQEAWLRHKGTIK